MDITKHTKTIVHAHNGLHTVYWTTGAVHYITIVDLVNACLYGSLAILTVLVSYCVACHHKGVPE